MTNCVRTPKEKEYVEKIIIAVVYWCNFRQFLNNKSTDIIKIKKVLKVNNIYNLLLF